MKISARIISFLFLTAILLISCKETPTQTESSSKIVFGHFAGYVGNKIYSHIFKYENGVLYKDTSHKYINYHTPYQGNWVKMNDSLIKYLNDKLLKYPSQFFAEKDTVFGMPDARDQGGYYLQIKKENGEERFWLFDTSTEHFQAYMKDYLSNMKDIIWKL
jgi:hypothetical protein